MAEPILMPALGMFTGEGTLTAWLRPPGAAVAADEPVAEITTEKTTQELLAPGTGILHHAVEVGATVPVQGVIGYVLREGEPLPHPPLPTRGRGDAETRGGPHPLSPSPSEMARGNEGTVPSTSSPLPLGEGQGVGGVSRPPTPDPRPLASDTRVVASPIARRLAAENGIDLATLGGSGPGGRIVEADVQAAIARRGTQPAGPAPGRRVRERVPMIGVRRTIAERLRASQSTVAAVTLSREVDAAALVVGRERLVERLGSAIPYDALFVKILAAALRERPTLNAVIEGDEILVLDEINVGIAVAVATGLIVPVVRDADRRPLTEVAAAVRDLSERARANRLAPDDVGGGTVTITNLGAYGVDAFTPIINPPQAAILGIGRILPRPVVRDGQLAVGTTCFLSLTFDHRVTDGAPAALLLDDVARLMNDPAFLDGL